MILFQLVRGVLEIYQLEKSSTYGFQDALNFDLGLTNWRSQGLVDASCLRKLATFALPEIIHIAVTE